MFTIGEFSRIAGMSAKTLRFYHEEGLLVPASVDPRTNYRFYDERNLQTARLIAWLRGMEFSVQDIRQVLRDAHDDGDLLRALERQKQTIDDRVRKMRGVSRSLRQFIERESRLQSAIESGPHVEEKTVAPMRIAAVRLKAPYRECGKAFARIGRQMGRFICGPPLLLHHDSEYVEDAADFEACFPVRQTKPCDGIEIRDLPGALCASLLHTGPYDEMGPSYAAVLEVRPESRKFRRDADPRGLPPRAGNDLQGQPTAIRHRNPAPCPAGVCGFASPRNGVVMRRATRELLVAFEIGPAYLVIAVIAAGLGWAARRSGEGPISGPAPPDGAV